MQKEKTVKVSVIMPSKNVVDYIDECLNSVENQTLKEIEIICVDAFSTDGTRSVLERHVKRDRRIKLLDDDLGSTGYAFNSALKVASGEYVGIVETDDYIDEYMFECLYSLAKEYDLDYIKADFNAFMEIKGERFFIPVPTFFNEDKRYYNKILIPKEYKNIRIADGYMWKGIYKKLFLEENNVQMHETKGAAFQDQWFLYQTVYRAKRVMYLDRYFYNYRRDNENSSVYSQSMIQKMMWEYHEIEKDIQEKRLSIEGMEKEFYYEKFARYKGVVVSSHIDFWEKSLNRMKLEFYEPFIKGYISRDSDYVYRDVVTLFNSTLKYMDRLKEEKQKFLSRIREMINFAADCDTIICCSGIIASGVLCLLKRFSTAKVIALSDNNKALWGKTINGIKVIPTENIMEFTGCKYIIANEKNAPLVYAQLAEMGIAEEDLYICDEVIDLNWIMDAKLTVSEISV